MKSFLQIHGNNSSILDQPVQFYNNDFITLTLLFIFILPLFGNREKGKKKKNKNLKQNLPL